MTQELDRILIEGAAEHNLKGIRVEIPKKKLVVLTGVSGSGKSSLAFDTLFAEGQRRYIESLSSYARQFLGQMEKPRYESIHGLTPTIAIDQKAASSNPRSTVGTITEIHDYLRVLYARVGVQHCYQCGRPVAEQSAQQIVEELRRLPEGTKLMLLAPVVRARKGEHREVLEGLRRQGFLRARIDGEVRLLEEPVALDKKRKHTVEAVVDRIIAGQTEAGRLADSVEAALRLGKGTLVAAVMGGEEKVYSELNACQYCGISYPELSPQLFSFNSPQGMCKPCNGLGTRFEMDPAKVIPDRRLSLADGAVEPWASAIRNRHGWTWRYIENICQHFGIPLDVPLNKLPPAQLEVLLHGSGEKIEFHFKGTSSEYRFQSRVEGILNTLARRLKETKSEDARAYYMKYFSDRICSDCGGDRLRAEARHVRVGGHGIVDLSRMPVGRLDETLADLALEGSRQRVAADLIREIRTRLRFLINVGLDYLTLDRLGPSLSGGESQRIRLASQVGTELTGVTYVLDEPSIGLHQKDNLQLIQTLQHMRDLGNTVVVVEHDRETILSADHVIDFGPGAGIHGGEVVFAGTPAQLRRSRPSLTGQYLSGRREIPLPKERRRPSRDWLVLRGARTHNLKGIDCRIPLGVLTFITGVSGAGKSSLVNHTLFPALTNRFSSARRPAGEFAALEGVEAVDKVIGIDQKPIGRTPRSNPATYVKVFDLIREVFAQQKESRMYGYKSGRFSFNVKGGRCEVCRGDGLIKVEMHFLPDVYVPCDTCHGKRFNEATLKVHFNGRTIAEVLEMTVEEAHRLFINFPRIRRILETLIEVGLGYIRLGQPSPTLSGGEAQRVKLSRELSRAGTGRTLYILDEPTTGLHFEDVRHLLQVLQRLVDAGNTVVVIEHNLDAIRTADWIIDLGPEGGERGGEIVAEGSPETIVAHPDSWTGKYLQPLL